MGARRDRPGGDETPLAAMPQTAASTLHVFHVDDSVDDHLLLKAAAEMAEVPFSWEVAESVDTAIFYLSALLALEETGPLKWPDLVLLDISLPHGGGFKVLQFIRSNPKLNSVRVIVLSGSDRPGILEEGYALGADSALLKPGSFRELVKLAVSLYAARGTARPLSLNLSPAVDLAHPTAR
jgi:CheY-like chemotaxis protein